MLYALEQQATEGPCNHSKPWGWNVVESAKHEAWTSLKDMPGMEAMRHFVQALEEDQVLSTGSAYMSSAQSFDFSLGTEAGMWSRYTA